MFIHISAFLLLYVCIHTLLLGSSAIICFIPLIQELSNLSVFVQYIA